MGACLLGRLVAHHGASQRSNGRGATCGGTLSAPLNFKLGQKLYWSGEFDRAIEVITKALELDPHFAFSHLILAHVYAWKGMYEESLATCEKVASLSGDSSYAECCAP
jgi:tetratricopeptide (TPR) repeat protein